MKLKTFLSFSLLAFVISFVSAINPSTTNPKVDFEYAISDLAVDQNTTGVVFKNQLSIPGRLNSNYFTIQKNKHVAKRNANKVTGDQVAGTNPDETKPEVNDNQTDIVDNEAKSNSDEITSEPEVSKSKRQYIGPNYKEAIVVNMKVGDKVQLKEFKPKEMTDAEIDKLFKAHPSFKDWWKDEES